MPAIDPEAARLDSVRFDDPGSTKTRRLGRLKLGPRRRVQLTQHSDGKQEFQFGSRAVRAADLYRHRAWGMWKSWEYGTPLGVAFSCFTAAMLMAHAAVVLQGVRAGRDVVAQQAIEPLQPTDLALPVPQQAVYILFQNGSALDDAAYFDVHFLHVSRQRLDVAAPLSAGDADRPSCYTHTVGVAPATAFLTCVTPLASSRCDDASAGFSRDTMAYSLVGAAQCPADAARAAVGGSEHSPALSRLVVRVQACRPHAGRVPACRSGDAAAAVWSAARAHIALLIEDEGVRYVHHDSLPLSEHRPATAVVTLQLKRTVTAGRLFWSAAQEALTVLVPSEASVRPLAPADAAGWLGDSAGEGEGAVLGQFSFDVAESQLRETRTPASVFGVLSELGGFWTSVTAALGLFVRWHNERDFERHVRARALRLMREASAARRLGSASDGGKPAGTESDGDGASGSEEAESGSEDGGADAPRAAAAAAEVELELAPRRRTAPSPRASPSGGRPAGAADEATATDRASTQSGGPSDQAPLAEPGRTRRQAAPQDGAGPVGAAGTTAVVAGRGGAAAEARTAAVVAGRQGAVGDAASPDEPPADAPRGTASAAAWVPPSTPVTSPAPPSPHGLAPAAPTTTAAAVAAMQSPPSAASPAGAAPMCELATRSSGAETEVAARPSSPSNLATAAGTAAVAGPAGLRRLRLPATAGQCSEPSPEAARSRHGEERRRGTAEEAVAVERASHGAAPAAPAAATPPTGARVTHASVARALAVEHDGSASASAVRRPHRGSPHDDGRPRHHRPHRHAHRHGHRDTEASLRADVQTRSEFVPGSGMSATDAERWLWRELQRG